MTELQIFVAMLRRVGATHAQTPDLHGSTCVAVGVEGYLTIEWFFDVGGKLIRTAMQKLATQPEWMEITPNTCGGGP